MSSYAELMRQIEDLKKQAEEQRKLEIAEAVADIKKKMALYGITARDLGFSERVRVRRSERKPFPAKYRNPVTNETWSGIGRKPKWVLEALAQGRTLDEFRIP